jgi:hypothetical protein
MSGEQRAAAERALVTWREYLVGERSDPGQFQQHIFPVDTLVSGPRKLLSPFLNRYLLRTVQEDVLANRDSVLTFAKLGRILLFGFVEPPRGLHGWQIRVRKGYIGPKQMQIPFAIGVYLRDQADQCGQFFASMTDKQKIVAQAGTDRAAAENLESFRAMQYDVRHTGAEAFYITRKKK